MKSNLKEAVKQYDEMHYANSQRHQDSKKSVFHAKNTDINSIKYIQELKKTLHESINKSEENVMESVGLLKDIESIAKQHSNIEQRSRRNNIDKQLVTFETQSTYHNLMSEKESKRLTPPVENLKVILNGRVVIDPHVIRRLNQDNKASKVDVLPKFDSKFGKNIDFQIYEKKPTCKLKSIGIQDNTICETNFYNVKPLEVNIRGQIDTNIDDGKSTFASIDERSMYFSVAGQSHNYPAIPHNPFINSEFREESSQLPITKFLNNRVQCLLNRQLSISDSENNTPTRVANIKEALRLGIALNRDRDHTNMHSVYNSKNDDSSALESPTPRLTFKQFDIENNSDSNYEMPVQNQQQSYRFVEKNDNFYKLQDALLNYQSNYNSNTNNTDWTELKSLNLCFGAPNMNLSSTGELEIKILEPQGTCPDNQYELPSICTADDFNTLRNGPRLRAQNTFSSSYWHKDKNSDSEREMFETKTLRVDRGEATYQSLSDREHNYEYSQNHPFTESLRSCDYTVSNNQKPSIKEHLHYNPQKPSVYDNLQQSHDTKNKNSQKIEDFNYNQENRESGLSNRLNQILNIADAKVLDFIETDQIFKKNTGHDYMEYQEANDLNVIEIDNNEHSFCDSNRFTDKCSLDAYTNTYKQARVQTRGAVSDNNTTHKISKLEAQYFSFNPND